MDSTRDPLAVQPKPIQPDLLARLRDVCARAIVAYETHEANRAVLAVLIGRLQDRIAQTKRRSLTTRWDKPVDDWKPSPKSTRIS